MPINWRFPKNDDSQDNGLNDGGMEHFLGTPIKSLAREICQNSLDAVLVPKEPVIVEFDSFEIPFSDIPGSDELKDVLDRIRNYWKHQLHSTKEAEFVKDAINETEKDKILCLRISDHNTCGLTGSKKGRPSDWHSLTKSQGVSDKVGTSGGSKGIGKFAPFNCSYLRTVFYSTLDKENNEAYQGVSRLFTFKDKDGDTTQGIGFYGDVKNTPVFEQGKIKPGYFRSAKDFGTDIYIIGFKKTSDWKEKIAASVLDGFLYSIYKEKLIVKVDGTTIDKRALPSRAISLKKYFEENADNYYAVLSADEKISPVFTKNIDGMGTVTLRMMIRPDLHRRAAIVRQTGMKIFDKGNISGYIPFAAVVYIEGDKINNVLRELENPQHTKWELDRASDKKLALKTTKAIYDFIKESLNNMIKDDVKETLDASVGEYLSEETDTDNNGKENINNKIAGNEIETHYKEISKEDDQMIDNSEGEDAESSDEGGEKPGNLNIYDPDGENDGSFDDSGSSIKFFPNPEPSIPNPHPEPFPPSPGDPVPNDNGDVSTASAKKSVNKKKNTAISAKVRVICIDKVKGEYRISIIPNVDASPCYIQLAMSAESGDYKTEIVSVSCATQPGIVSSSGKITNVSLSKGIQVVVDFTINYHDYCAMEASIWK